MNRNMIDLSSPAPSTGDSVRLARLVRHLEARLNDFGPVGPEVRSADQQTGVVLAAFSGRSPQKLADALAQNFGILVRAEGECIVFRLTADCPFEDLDYVWGCLFQILSES